MKLKELDLEWNGQNVDKSAMKLLCRKYSPELLMEWIHRGLTVKPDEVIKWHKAKLQELGQPILETPIGTKENLAEDYGDYFQ